MHRTRGRIGSPPNWELLVGLVATGFIIYVWVWAATQGGPPFW
ncbi:hypothetical protein [Actinomadura mexicana]|uniref:Uncharacterized protein n=1 Tax=Actinomadura mexicana TaxID=134959 RepID=A0A238VWU4_9ACTN|nr:hypothetical protein [Actinomadura mexicana]SNR38718.1 hypothetical protein SAMN06265355_102474 [Actinomadura mexicana]